MSQVPFQSIPRPPFGGRWQAWLVAVPVVGYLGLATADQAARLLPNLM
jgi:hypothetical protein